jgi:RNA polymerase-binding transcription factor DksA
MSAANRSLRDRLAREEREMQRRVLAFRRRGQKPVGIVDVPERRQTGWFDAAATAVVEQQRDLVWQRLAERSRAVVLACDRVREGTYGICADCGHPIPRRRLEVLPTATRCVHCQERRETAMAA